MNSEIVYSIDDQLAEFINSDIKRLQTLPNVPDNAKNYIKFLFQINVLDKPSHYLKF
jgi:hypothetical protein